MTAHDPASGTSPLAAARRPAAVKIGSSLLVDASTGHVNRAWLEVSLAGDLAQLRKRDQEILVVS